MNYVATALPLRLPVAVGTSRGGSIRMTAAQPPLATSPLRPRAGRRVTALTVYAAGKGKGFSKKVRKERSKKPSDSEDGDVRPTQKTEKRVKFKGKKTARTGMQRGPAIPQTPAVPTIEMPDLVSQAEADAAAAAAEADFEKRLAMVAFEGQQRKEEAVDKQASIFDGDIYDNPPPLSQTLMGKSSSDASPASPADDLSSGTFGPGQVALTGISIFAAVAFLATSFSSDLVLSTGGGGPKSASKIARERSKAETEKAKEAAATFEAALKENSEDLQALEGAGVTYAELGDYEKAIAKLKKLASAKPDDVDVLRLLAEAQSANGDAKSAGESYKKAISAAGMEKLELLQGLSDSLIADKKASKAVAEVLEARTRVAEGSSNADFGVVEADLLLARVYAGWGGHTNDALKVYDSLIALYPDDFRGYLAKGVLLRSNGQKGDAERMFIQAKYLAPKEARAVVNRVSSE